MCVCTFKSTYWKDDKEVGGLGNEAFEKTSVCLSTC